MISRFTLEELEAIETLRTGTFGDLKIETDYLLVWYSPSNHVVTVEELQNLVGKYSYWKVVDRYNAQ